nr:clec16a-like protein [Ipomoea batatas]
MKLRSPEKESYLLRKPCGPPSGDPEIVSLWTNSAIRYEFCGLNYNDEVIDLQEKSRYLTDQLMKVQVVNEVNKDFVIEALRSIAELITYGDQHDGAFFECELNTFF